MKNKEAEKIFLEIAELRRCQKFFIEPYGRDTDIGYISEFRCEDDFEKEILCEASAKIAAIYEEKIRQKINELAASYDN